MGRPITRRYERARSYCHQVRPRQDGGDAPGPVILQGVMDKEFGARQGPVAVGNIVAEFIHGPIIVKFRLPMVVRKKAKKRIGKG